MTLLIYGFFFAVLLMPVFTSTIIFEKHGKECKRGSDQECGYNCKCNESNLCECTKPQNAGELQFCYNSIPTLLYGVVTCYKDRIRLKCYYDCPEGLFEDPYRMTDNRIATCLNKVNKWSEPVPRICYHNDCLDEINIKNGVPKCINSTENKKICKISCEKSFKLIGNEEMTCVKPSGPESGWTGIKPMCLNSACVDIMIKKITIDNTEPPNCIVSERDNSVTCNITCKKGYRREGNHEIHCFDKKTQTFPICFNNPKKCKHLQKGDEFANMRIVECRTNKEGDQYTCKYECIGFYQFRGNVAGKRKWASCKFSVGKWEFSECIHQPYMCKSLEVAGVKAKCSLGVRAIKNKTWTCNLECNEDFTEKSPCESFDQYQVYLCKQNKTGKQLTCNYGNEWDSNPITCLKNFDCEPGNNPYTTYSCTGKQFDKDYQCTITCGQGYHVSGSGTMKCLKESKWDSWTFCKKNYECPMPGNTMYDCPPFQNFGNSRWKCKFWCIPIRGVIQRQEGVYYCQKDGKWAGTLPDCGGSRN